MGAARLPRAGSTCITSSIRSVYLRAWSMMIHDSSCVFTAAVCLLFRNECFKTRSCLFLSLASFLVPRGDGDASGQPSGLVEVYSVCARQMLQIDIRVVQI